ncbi:uncharacterized protein LOC106171208 [Lingula anatina]|uniref:Uncharacterized protein LOC106171208 n=1 Tax=Lingula anatina TaxID=7574 RepID=A0A1S3J906_LINAN|nr:uncharacterized protein LOC106171208 [Lingula anatina]|eukprot:XP_013406880.1 uncharacterized protein LOC106171208 [Lingula anatina]
MMLGLSLYLSFVGLVSSSGGFSPLHCYDCNFKTFTYGNGLKATHQACVDPEKYGHLLAKVPCDTACFNRLDENGFVYRGCYTGNFGVDSSQDGCSFQVGATWCFCRMYLCNTALNFTLLP